MLGIGAEVKNPVLKNRQLPEYFFEPNIEDQKLDSNLEIVKMMASVRVLGHLEEKILVKLQDFVETVHLSAGSHLYRPGEPDTDIYMIKSGLIEVYLMEKDGGRYIVNRVSAGGNIHSILSVLDVLTGHPSFFKTMHAQAAVDCVIYKFPVINLLQLFSPESPILMKILQVIGIRLQNVTFTALHNYLGLSSELIQRKPCSSMSALPNLDANLTQILNKTDIKTRTRGSHRNSTATYHAVQELDRGEVPFDDASLTEIDNHVSCSPFMSSVCDL
ncbi:Patatin-like phospholipase domain-containing protein 7 [Cichlidogyrus casuarinus]|uniref:Patatin-like phospholipase domain-containing protein 7 n=1 Tax=Cichlidogyrus casuarinus TaxID=1844966 RepID=A0ABD2Q8X9_9PLAT